MPRLLIVLERFLSVLGAPVRRSGDWHTGEGESFGTLTEASPLEASDTGSALPSRRRTRSGSSAPSTAPFALPLAGATSHPSAPSAGSSFYKRAAIRNRRLLMVTHATPAVTTDNFSGPGFAVGAATSFMAVG